MCTTKEEQDVAYELCSRVVRLAAKAGVTVGTAESCTGGLVCTMLTDVAGSSSVVRGGVVSYAVQVKEDVLGVPTSITQSPSVGVVSEECAIAMCEGARRVLGCSMAVSTTGIAGPTGEEPGKPVGTVWIGIATQRGSRAICKHFSGNRASVRNQAARTAITLLEEELLGVS